MTKAQDLIYRCLRCGRELLARSIAGGAVEGDSTVIKPRLVILFVILFMLSMCSYGLWMGTLNLVACVTTWAISASSWAVGFLALRNVGHLISLAGCLCNGTVIIANNGQMPVLFTPLETHGSIWVEADSSHRLLFLADRFFGVGASIGDILLCAGLLTFLVVAIYRTVAKSAVNT